MKFNGATCSIRIDWTYVSVGGLADTDDPFGIAGCTVETIVVRVNKGDWKTWSPSELTRFEAPGPWRSSFWTIGPCACQ